MPATAEDVKKLRELSGAGVMECKKALDETGGDVEKAVKFLRENGIAMADKKSSRETSQGIIDSYIHAGGRIGVLVEVNCETDFVANTDEFRAFVKDLALHIASPAAPKYLARDDVSADEVERVASLFEAQAKETGKPENVIAKIVEGKLEAFYKDHVLLEQPFVKDDSKTIQQYLEEVGAKTGEKVVVRRFARFKLGEDAE